MSLQPARADSFASGIPASSGVASLPPVLIVLHQETSSPGRVGNVLRAIGHPLDIRRPRFGDPLPDTLDAHAGAVIFGGPMSANDDDDYIRREKSTAMVQALEALPPNAAAMMPTASSSAMAAPIAMRLIHRVIGARSPQSAPARPATRRGGTR